ncbi:stage VI sporulation protein F [Lysinibacillus agricola]|uniref:Stage VI sporulation protein F n=1 Tax=Lysinibacillus agricola TaxID=2590012 RepID=A0ABX7AYS0_9BACI|nr:MULTISPECIES: stage VI sporulation protein F [Lysinibacillus]KOS60650.1 sporulation protein [Lysinibacillus sp. FJAT-14222]MEB2298417.1 stage VI sporulation protein F [Lysinibacillus xylanilyticus]QQP13339.1 stage VI sporulation protein F [Lysinibacillus agricola]
MNRGFFNSIEQKTGVSMDEIFALANAIQHADFKNEKQVRKIVRRVSKVSNRQITQELEDKLVQSIIQDGASLDFDKITKMMK